MDAASMAFPAWQTGLYTNVFKVSKTTYLVLGIRRRKYNKVSQNHDPYNVFFFFFYWTETSIILIRNTGIKQASTYRINLVFG